MTPIERALILQLINVVFEQEERLKELSGADQDQTPSLDKLVNTLAIYIQEMPESDFKGVVDFAETLRR